MFTASKEGSGLSQPIRPSKALPSALWGASKFAFIAAFVFSAVVNLLHLTAPLYMMQIYDRVLASGSEATLLVLSILVVFLFFIMGILDHSRNRLLARIGFRLKARLEPRLMAQRIEVLALQPHQPLAQNLHRDLDLWARPWSTPTLGALIDLPWTLVFVAALFMFHPLLGWFTLAAGGLLLALILGHQYISQEASRIAHQKALWAEQDAEQLRIDSSELRALGMSQRALTRWYKIQYTAQELNLKLADQAGLSGAMIKAMRLLLQSMILGLGAWLVLRGQLSAGAMIAASILLGRALQPIEILIGQWEIISKAHQAKGRLRQFLKLYPERQTPLPLPRPHARLEVSDLTLLAQPAEQIILNSVNFSLYAGQALAVVGASGSGKSALARALVGLWPPRRGSIRLDGAELTRFETATLGSYLGYLPQDVNLFRGTIAENIARLTPDPDPQAVYKAAIMAGCHEMIMRLPQGYDTSLQALGEGLSGGQKQRIALARALYGDPLLLVLDEPNSNLDHEGAMALNRAIRQAKTAGAMVILMAHRPAALMECDQVLMLQSGQMLAFGPRDQVLQKVLHPREGAA